MLDLETVVPPGGVAAPAPPPQVLAERPSAAADASSGRQHTLVDGLHERRVLGRPEVSRLECHFSRECLAIEVGTSLPGIVVTRVLDRIAASRGYPAVIVVDNGPEFRGREMDAWACRKDVRLHFIDPGKPMQNGFVESFNDKFRYQNDWIVCRQVRLGWYLVCGNGSTDLLSEPIQIEERLTIVQASSPMPREHTEWLAHRISASIAHVAS